MIEDIENEESDLKNEITAKGRFLSSYMDRRLIKINREFFRENRSCHEEPSFRSDGDPACGVGNLKWFHGNSRVSSDYEKPYDLRNKTGKGRNDRLSFPARLPEQEKLYLKPTKGPTGPRRRVSIPALSFRRVTTNLNNVIL